MRCSPMREACQEVPQATKMMRLALRNLSLLSFTPERVTSQLTGSILPLMQSMRVSGCSKISFSMK